MKRKSILAFVIMSLALYGAEEIDTTISKEVTATNQQQLDIKEIDTEELLLKNQNLESSSVEISGENFKEGEDKVVVQQATEVVLEQELSQGVEEKSFFRKVIDFFKGN